MLQEASAGLSGSCTLTATWMHSWLVIQPLLFLLMLCLSLWFLQPCLPSATFPLPSNIMCQPCQEDDIIRTLGTCQDDLGRLNKTYAWRQPKLCNENLNGSAVLPENKIVGPCSQEWHYIPSENLSPKYVFVFASLGIGVVVSLIIALVTWIKHQRLRRHYTLLLQREQGLELEDIQAEVRRNGGH